MLAVAGTQSTEKTQLVAELKALRSTSPMKRRMSYKSCDCSRSPIRPSRGWWWNTLMVVACRTLSKEGFPMKAIACLGGRSPPKSQARAWQGQQLLDVRTVKYPPR